MKPAQTRYRRPHPGTQPDYNYPPYASTQKRCPTQPLILPPQTLSEITGPIFGTDEIKPTDNDLTRQHKGDPIGERIVVSGRVLDENGRAVPHTLGSVLVAAPTGSGKTVGAEFAIARDDTVFGEFTGKEGEALDKVRKSEYARLTVAPVSR